MKINYNTPNVFLVSGYSERCNKFVEYCLGLSKEFFLGEKHSFKHLMPNLEDYEYRLQFCKSRLPPSLNQKNLRIDRFIGVPNHFYLDAEEYWSQGNDTDRVSEEFVQLTNSDLKFCLNVSGQSIGCLNYSKVWPNAKIIRVVNINLASQEGNESVEKYQQLAGGDWPSWEQMVKNNFVVDRCVSDPNIKREMSEFYKWNELVCPVYELDFNFAVSNQEQFCQEIEQLYRFADLQDFNKHMIEEYYRCSLDTFLAVYN